MTLLCWRERRLIGFNVEELRRSAGLGFPDSRLFGSYKVRELRCRVIHIAGYDCLDRANDHTSGFKLGFDSMRAEVALLGGVCVGIDVQGIVRTGLHAGLATDAAIAVEVDDAVVEPVERSYRADGYARSVVAVIAPEHGKETASVWILTLLYVLDPGPESAERDFVLGLASDSARVTADAFAMVYDEAVFHLMDARRRLLWIAKTKDQIDVTYG